MNKTKIDWCDSTWNPVTGCRHICEYCYARRIATRFGGKALDIPHTLNKAFVRQGKAQPYPFGFTPTFHRYRLNDYIDKKGRNIFVCSMADLFASWVPDEWIEEVFEACEKVQQHNYLFLTKNPGRYVDLINKGKLPSSENMWYGASVTYLEQLQNTSECFGNLPCDIKGLLSIEPILEDITEDQTWGYCCGGKYMEWVIIGAETGRRKDKVVPEREWIEKIVNDCKMSNIPVFMKSSLAEIWGEPLLQEFPKALKQK